MEITEALRRYRGWGRYNHELVRALLDVGDEHCFELFFHQEPDAEPSALLDEFRHRNVRLHSIRLPRLAYDALEEDRTRSFVDDCFAGADVYHAVTEFPFHTRRMRKVVTIHELSPLRFPDRFSVERVDYFRRYIEENVREAAAIVTVSEATRSDLLELFDARPEQVICIPNGVSELFFEPQARVASRKDPFLLYVGSVLDPLKNVGALLDAVSELRVDIRLVLVTDELDHEGLVRYFRLRPESANRVFVVGAVADRELKKLYEQASLLVFPSLHEGFGLPVAEAMAVGCPVLCGNHSSLREVTGGLCATFESGETNDLRAALASVLERYPSELLAAARARVERLFRWDRVARECLSLYRTLGA